MTVVVATWENLEYVIRNQKNHQIQPIDYNSIKQNTQQIKKWRYKTQVWGTRARPKGTNYVLKSPPPPHICKKHIRIGKGRGTNLIWMKPIMVVATLYFFSTLSNYAELLCIITYLCWNFVGYLTFLITTNWEKDSPNFKIS